MFIMCLVSAISFPLKLTRCLLFSSCVSKDGSCNGLQHYAALGRNSVGFFVFFLYIIPSFVECLYFNFSFTSFFFGF